MVHQENKMCPHVIVPSLCVCQLVTSVLWSLLALEEWLCFPMGRAGQKGVGIEQQPNCNGVRVGFHCLILLIQGQGKRFHLTAKSRAAA